MSAPNTTVRWVSLPVAADVLGMTAPALRKTLDRRAVKVADGGIEADLDGVRGRKMGRLWRVTLSVAWTTATPKKTELPSPSSQNMRADREGPRS